MSVDSLEDLFVDGLQKLYYTEKQLLDALEELESDSTNESIQDAFAEHREETQTHVERLEEAFERIDRSPETERDRIVDAMIEEHEEFTSEDPDQTALERFAVAAGQKSEHYEIAAYGNVIPLADRLGYDEVADLLEQNLREEQAALDDLSELGEQFDYGELSASA